jgi:molybdopterin-containing oxidoreductase family membrane subunit
MNQRTGLMISVALIAFGLVGSAYLLFEGHHIMGTSHRVPWGLLISAYAFFVGSSTGVFLISSLGYVFDIQPFHSIARRSLVVAIITLLSGFIVMGVETPQPFHMLYMLISPNWTAAIFWMGSLYGAYLLLLSGVFWHMVIKNNPAKARWFGIFALLTALAASSNLGAVFGFFHARPYWEGPYLPIYFILSALLSGSALLTLLFYLKEGRNSASPVVPAIARLLTLFLSIMMFFTIWKILTGLYGHVPGKAEAYQALLTGPYSLNFWILEVTVGMVTPLTLLLVKKTRRAAFTAAALSLFGIFFMRYDLVMVGQVVPLEVIDHLPLPVTLLTYSPTWVEWAVVSLGMGFAGLCYLLVEKRFDLSSPASGPDSSDAHATAHEDLVN